MAQILNIILPGEVISPYWWKSDFPHDVQCMFSKSDEVELAAVAKGQKITLRGEVSGKLGNIIVKSCEIVK